ncbi:hypothetical protein KVR01_012872 [Diaporthe batatas]|uniref:uncharacterized protein n=1 Tax=Diaporthe batatas TaxID=748121 RepID=UPI001D05209B|nr:uncharacterized protein KVR01_012872 [Diaporthe batatas]KAG8157164.1 hypothetical protein KVR01_012872 [Diaporthe batatas]
MTPEVATLARDVFESCKSAGGRVDHVKVTLDPAEARRITRLKGAQACFAWPASTLQPWKLVAHIMRGNVAQEPRFNLQTYTTVRRVTESGQPGRWLVHSDRGSVECSQVVHATNAYSAAVEPSLLGLVTPTPHMCNKVVPSPRFSGSKALGNSYGVLLPDGALFSVNPRPTSDGVIMFGGSNPGQKKFKEWLEKNPEHWTDDVLSEFPEINAAVKALAEEQLEGWAAAVPAPGVLYDYSWSGIIGNTTDGVPFIGEVPGLPGQWILISHHKPFTRILPDLQTIADRPHIYLNPDLQHTLSIFLNLGMGSSDDEPCLLASRNSRTHRARSCQHSTQPLRVGQIGEMRATLDLEVSLTASHIRAWDIQTDYMSEAASLTHGIPTYPIPDMSRVQDDMDRQPLYQGSSDPFMVENDDLRSQRATQNPWRTLARFRNPLDKKHLGLGARFPLLSLPFEILLIVVGHLPIESAACLVLACKTTYLKLGTASFKMSKPDLWKFLLLIEHERQNSYACSRCLTLHRPPDSQLHGRYRCCRGWSWLSPGVLPDTITPGLVKMIGRKWLEDPRSCQEYLSWGIMSEKKTTRYIKLATHVIPRMLGGSLVLRTETYIHPFFDGHLTQRTLMELVEQVNSNTQLPDVCSHQKWASHLTNLPRLKKDVKPTKCVEAEDDHDHWTPCYSNERIMRVSHGHEYPIEMCDLIHQQPCRTWKIQTPKSTAGTLELREAREDTRPKLEETYSGEIMGCRKCITDYSVSAREVPGLGYCMVLTTWKDLGGVGVGFSDKWNHHIASFGFLDVLDDVRSEDQVGQAYEAFENLERSYLGTPQRYHPQPDRKMIRDLTRRVQKLGHSIDSDDTTDSDADTDSGDDTEVDL